ncbi:MAG: hypothetical protein HC903_23970 [Methylacidiphilales bacterium]|nr:hypothetical protein [Candidatus Methylacidiphilales bacterium]
MGIGYWVLGIGHWVLGSNLRAGVLSEAAKSQSDTLHERIYPLLSKVASLGIGNGLKSELNIEPHPNLPRKSGKEIRFLIFPCLVSFLPLIR